MSLPRCNECDANVPRGELTICETCERVFCVQCLPAHSPCAIEARLEQNVPWSTAYQGSQSSNRKEGV